MADTARTSADLLTNIFPDGQAAGAITAQDIRDFVVSVKPAHAACSMATPAATTITVAGTYYKAAGATTFDADTDSFDDDLGTSNRLKYIGAPDRHCEIIATISMTCGSSNQVLGFKLAVNGVVVDDSVSRRKVGTSSDVGGITLAAHADLSTNDYIEVWCTNETSTATVTLDNMHFKVTGFID